MKTTTTRRLAALLATLFLATLLLASPVAGEDDATTTFLKGIGKLFKGKDAKAISAYFPATGKVELRLAGVNPGHFRNAQAKSLLATYFKTIESPEYKLKSVNGLVGKFETSYRIVEDGRKAKGTTHVYLQKEGESWLIVGIVES